MNRITNNCLPLILLAAFSGCSTTPDYSNPLSHDLGPAAQQTAQQCTVSVYAPVWLWDDRIRYRLLYDDATAVRYYNLDRWEAPLATLLQHHFMGLGSKPCRLKIAVKQFEQQFQNPTDARVVIQLSVSALPENGGRPLTERSFSLSQKTATPDAAGAINGFIALLDRVKASIRTWLSTLPDRQTASLVVDVGQQR